MAEFILECKCKQMQMYWKWAKGTPNRKHWVIRCKNCNAYVETVKKEKAIEMWNSWDMFHPNKIHTELKEQK